MRVTFNELAERELKDAAQYYEREQSGLGTAFIAEVRRCAGDGAAGERQSVGPTRRPQEQSVSGPEP